MEIVNLLLERGADPNLPEEGIAPHGHALYAAVANKHYEIAKLLLEHGAYPNPEVESSADALSRAISNSDQPMIDLLCSYGAARAVHLMAYYGDVQTAAAVFAANPARADDPAALSNAAGQGQEAFMRLLLRYQPDLPRRITFPDWSVGAKTRELNELLFEHGMNPSQPDWLRVTPLHQFARKGDVENAALFLDHGADLHGRDEDIRSTPLGWAAKYGKTLMAEFLLRRGARTNLPDDPPWATPLAWASRRGHGEIAELLKQHGAT
jgi:ankyrin repeat protein